MTRARGGRIGTPWVVPPSGPFRTPPPAPRKGATTRAGIPKPVLAALNGGEDETVTLVEWLAVDQPALIRAAFPSCGLRAEAGAAAAAAAARADVPFTKRTRAVGADLAALLPTLADGAEIFVALASHRSDMVRAWAAYALSAAADVPLPTRLKISRHFAADRNMGVRECAWDVFRAHVAADLVRGLSLLRPWVDDAEDGIRRCAIEATRPRGVWTPHIEALKADPSPGLPLLEAVRSDSSRYVLAAAGNWLNDASKSNPAWVKSLAARWNRESPTAETAWLLKRALRTLVKEARN